MAFETQMYRFNGRALDVGELFLGISGDNLIRRIGFELPRIAEKQLAYIIFEFPNPVKEPLTESENAWTFTVGGELLSSSGIYKTHIEVFDSNKGRVWQSANFISVIKPGSDVNDAIKPVALPELLKAEAALAEANAKTDAILAAVGAETERVQAENEREAYIEQLKSDVEAGKFNGKAGEKGEKGDKGDIGPAGANGEKGDKGEKGDAGASGANGNDGTSVTIESVILGMGSGAANTVIFSDGNRMTVQNGKDGKNGAPGPAGADGAPGMPGAPGESGVYVGTETPNNNANVWINPEGEVSTLPIASSETLGGVKVGEGLEIAEDGVLSAKSTEGKYEFIDEITVTENAFISMTKTPDGRDYNFSAIYIGISLNGGELTASKNIDVYSDLVWESRIAALINAASSGNVSCRHELKLENGMWKCESIDFSPNGTGRPIKGFNLSNVCLESEHSSVKMLSSSAGWPIGTTFKIYGVWKDA